MLDANVTLCDSRFMPQLQGLLTTTQVAAELGLHLRKVQRLAESGDLPYAQRLPGPYGRYLFDATQVELWQLRRAQQQREEAKAS